MRMGRQEAIDIFRKWDEERSLVRVQGSFPLFVFGLWGRIGSLTSQELRITNVDTQAELAIKFAEELEYGYADNREIFGKEKEFSDGILIFFRTEIDSEIPNHIALAALVAS